jgi:plastocyanin
MGRTLRFRALVVVGLLAVATPGACGPSAPTPSPTARPTPTPVPGPSLPPGPNLSVLALNIDFEPSALNVPANAPFVIHFGNGDSPDISHVVDIRGADGQTLVEEQEPILGGLQADYVYRPLQAGDYVFICRIHPIPSMTGTLRVR